MHIVRLNVQFKMTEALIPAYPPPPPPTPPLTRSFDTPDAVCSMVHRGLSRNTGQQWPWAVCGERLDIAGLMALAYNTGISWVWWGTRKPAMWDLFLSWQDIILVGFMSCIHHNTVLYRYSSEALKISGGYLGRSTFYKWNSVYLSLLLLGINEVITLLVRLTNIKTLNSSYCSTLLDVGFMGKVFSMPVCRIFYGATLSFYFSKPLTEEQKTYTCMSIERTIFHGGVFRL